MSNKEMSELSKPVAYDYQYAGVETREGFSSWREKLTRDCPPDWMIETGKVKSLKPRYSQEYVSALLAELEAKDKRIAELEAKLATPVRLPLPYQQDITCVLLNKRKVVAAIHAAGLKIEGMVCENS